ncbi:hypothetical protein TWF281_007226 [Arthrobotrys megalospora]
MSGRSPKSSPPQRVEEPEGEEPKNSNNNNSDAFNNNNNNNQNQPAPARRMSVTGATAPMPPRKHRRTGSEAPLFTGRGLPGWTPTVANPNDFKKVSRIKEDQKEGEGK